MQIWACAGRTNAAIAPQVSATYEGSRQAALSYVATATAEIKKGIEKGGMELEIPDLEAIGKATNAVGSARRKFGGSRGFRISYASTLHALAGHELCTRDTWVYPLGLSGGNNRGHPTASGQRAIARAVVPALRAIL